MIDEKVKDICVDGVGRKVCVWRQFHTVKAAMINFATRMDSSNNVSIADIAFSVRPYRNNSVV